MFVRWKSRARKRHHRYGHPETPRLLTAVLVESHRVDGKPRQRTVAYLGSIRDDLLDEADVRWLFWRAMAARLDALGLPSAERARAEAAILDVVPRPTEGESVAATKARQAAIAAGVRRAGR